MLTSRTLLKKPRSVKGNFNEVKSYVEQEKRYAEPTKKRKLREELKALKEKLHTIQQEHCRHAICRCKRAGKLCLQVNRDHLQSIIGQSNRDERA